MHCWPALQEKPKLASTFNCPLCNASNSVRCQMDWETERGTVKCDKCQQFFTSNINHLSEAVDVYQDWLDMLDEANER